MNNFIKKLIDDKYRNYLAAAIGCFLLGFLLLMSGLRQNQEDLASRIAPGILRFHILANSDSNQDQEIKLEIRSLILDYVQSSLNPGAGKAETIRYIEEHKASIEELAKQYLAQKGFGYGAALQLLTCYFPARAYGSMVFPCGFYDAVRIILGKGEGHNWWCVLYPRFCFTDGICSEVPSESVKKLQEEINQDDFLSIKDRRPDIIIRLRLFPEFSLRLSPDENQSLTVAKPFTPH